MHRARGLLVVALAVTLASGCTADHDGRRTSASASATCTPAPILGDGTLAGGSDDGQSVSALIERTESGPVRVGEPIKVIVRMTGEGDLAVSAVHPDGTETGPEWGPEPHGASNFGGPGDEWGFGVTFDAAGCWTLALRRSEAGTGYLQLEVV